ncbi:hypothetical protein [Aneurinibacillus tyrosinisolvens]|uniref:hypothetical protein n=1 Tax=Aneurinibacillus tyrosinisolvens TaxID=1443435 RepID=UPI00063F2637|nr:hypothetical protein [Aneurinibacillus tyrosinisolvens]
MKKRVYTAFWSLLIFLMMDLYLWANAYVPITNHLYRIASLAPAVHVNGKLLIYNGTLNFTSVPMIPYKESDEAHQLFQTQESPYINAPSDNNTVSWIVLPYSNEKAFMYSYPKNLWE